jgi:hypothetical protein
MLFWKDNCFDRLKHLVETDFGEKWENLQPFIKFKTLENMLVNNDSDAQAVVRAEVIYCPFFFREYIKFSLDKLPSHLKKSIKHPIYLLCAFTDYASLSAWLQLLPIFKMIPIFITTGKADLIGILEKCFNT